MIARPLPARLKETLRQMVVSERDKRKRLEEMEAACSDEELATMVGDCRAALDLHLERIRLILATLTEGGRNGDRPPEAEAGNPAMDDAAMARRLHAMVADSLSRHFAARMYADMLALFEAADMLDMSLEEDAEALERLDLISELLVRSSEERGENAEISSPTRPRLVRG